MIPCTKQFFSFLSLSLSHSLYLTHTVSLCLSLSQPDSLTQIVSLCLSLSFSLSPSLLFLFVQWCEVVSFTWFGSFYPSLYLFFTQFYQHLHLWLSLSFSMCWWVCFSIILEVCRPLYVISLCINVYVYLYSNVHCNVYPALPSISFSLFLRGGACMCTCVRFCLTRTLSLSLSLYLTYISHNFNLSATLRSSAHFLRPLQKLVARKKWPLRTDPTKSKLL